MVATICKEQHDFGGAVEVGLVGWDEGQRLDELLMHATRVTGAEQGFEVENAAARLYGRASVSHLASPGPAVRPACV